MWTLPLPLPPLLPLPLPPLLPLPTAPAGPVPTDVEVQAASMYASAAKRQCISPAHAPELRAALVFEAQVVSAAVAALPPPPAAQGAAPGAQGLVIPAGTPPWAVSLCTQLHERFYKRCDELQGSFYALQGSVDKLLNRTGRARVHALDHNARAVDDTPLAPVPHPDTGELPPQHSFPADADDLRVMLDAPIDALLTFYGVPHQGMSAEQRRYGLAKEIGCGHLFYEQ